MCSKGPCSHSRDFSKGSLILETLKSSPEPLSSKSHIAHNKVAVSDVAFSGDGLFLVSGDKKSKDKRLLLWPINSEILEGQENPKPIDKELNHKQINRSN